MSNYNPIPECTCLKGKTNHYLTYPQNYNINLNIDVILKCDKLQKMKIVLIFILVIKHSNKNLKPYK